MGRPPGLASLTLTLIFESLGGVSGEAERVIKSLNKAVAENTDTSESEVATLF